jgi:hypothetical protein
MAKDQTRFYTMQKHVPIYALAAVIAPGRICAIAADAESSKMAPMMNPLIEVAGPSSLTVQLPKAPEYTPTINPSVGTTPPKRVTGVPGT